MKRLTELGLKFGTDKADYHEFTEFYHDYFEKKAELVPNPRILEIGILDGGSLKTYDEFFAGKATIIGVDTAEKGYLFPDSKTISTLRCDILSNAALEKITKVADDGFDIIIDDGGHTMEQQQRGLTILWQFLKPGGYFIIEDLHTSGIEDYNPDRTTTTLSILKGLGEQKFYSSAYLTEERLKELDAEMEAAIVCENEFPQARTQSPRVSITSLIIKKESEAIKQARLEIEAKKTPVVNHNLGSTASTEPKAETVLLQQETTPGVNEGTANPHNFGNTLTQRD